MSGGPLPPATKFALTRIDHLTSHEPAGSLVGPITGNVR